MAIVVWRSLDYRGMNAVEKLLLIENISLGLSENRFPGSGLKKISFI